MGNQTSSGVIKSVDDEFYPRASRVVRRGYVSPARPLLIEESNPSDADWIVAITVTH